MMERMTAQGPILTNLGRDLDVSKISGPQLLIHVGKHVLRPGGVGLTRRLLDGLAINANDDVIEFAPGRGTTTRLILDRHPRDYLGVARDIEARRRMAQRLPQDPSVNVVVGAPDKTSLPADSASVVLGEAVLTLNTSEQQQRIVAEASRILRPGGRFGLHEVSIVPDQMPPQQRQKIEQSLYSAIYGGVHPLPMREWETLLGTAGFKIVKVGYAPLYPLRPRRLFQDEGIAGALRLAVNLLLDRKARQRVLAIRKVFEQYRDDLRAIFIVAQKGA